MSSCDVGGKLADNLADFDYMDFTRLTQFSMVNQVLKIKYSRILIYGA